MIDDTYDVRVKKSSASKYLSDDHEIKASSLRGIGSSRTAYPPDGGWGPEVGAHSDYLFPSKREMTVQTNYSN
jgi:hypothetical protein